MSPEKNKETAVKFLNAVAAADHAEIERMMAPDFTWWNIGPTPPFGTCQREDFITLGSVLHNNAAGPMTFTYGDITAEDDRVCIECWSHLKMNNGKTYQNTYHFLFKLRGDQIVSGKEFLDNLHVMDVLGEYFPAA